jgi:hypothetical protein
MKRVSSLFLMLVVFSTLSTIAQERRTVVNRTRGYVAPSQPLYLPNNTNTSSVFSSGYGLNAEASVSFISKVVIPEGKLSASGAVSGSYQKTNSGIQVNMVEIPKGVCVDFYREGNKWGIPNKGWAWVPVLQTNVPTSLNSNLKYTYEGNNAVYVLCRYVDKKYGAVFVYINRGDLCNPSIDNCPCR